MSARLRELYATYEGLEEIPSQMTKAAKAGTEKCEAALAEISRTQRAAAHRHEQAVAAVKSRHRSAHGEIENRLRAAAQSATQKGALPATTAMGTGGAPEFARLRTLDARLGQAIDDKRKLEFTLQRLREQIKHEEGYSEARKRDRVTSWLLCGGAFLSVVVGANFLGAIIAIVAASVVQLRLTHWQSAYVLAQSKKFPSIGYNTRLRGAVVRVIAAWCLLALLLVTVVASNILQRAHPYWSETGLWRWMPSGALGAPGFGAYVSAILFWLAFVYAIILLITGYVRRAER